MNIADYTIPNTSFNNTDLLRDWTWLVTGAPEPVMITVFGDQFWLGEEGHVEFLDLISGTVTPIAPSEAEFRLELEDPEKFDHWFMPYLADELRDLGMEISGNKCYSYKIPPKLGGKIEPENIEPCDITVYYSILRQLHLQIGDLAPGTKITDINVNGPSAKGTSIFGKVRGLFAKS